MGSAIHNSRIDLCKVCLAQPILVGQARKWDFFKEWPDTTLCVGQLKH